MCMETNEKYMKMAVEEARCGIHHGHGGPFGTVIVKDGKVVAKGHNRVVELNDPTCHGEIDAIRRACKELGTFDLSGCTLYTTGEPCPMCFTACLWANIDKVYYGCDIAENEMIGFRDNDFYGKVADRNAMEGFLTQVGHDDCVKLFEEYNSIQDKTHY